MRVLVLNVGSSSLKGSIVDTADLAAIAKDEVSLGADASRRRGLDRTVRSLLSKLGITAPSLTLPQRREVQGRPAGEGRMLGVEAVGHRVVHGGTRFRSAVRVDDRVLKGIEALAEFAPLHNRVAAATIRAARSALPAIPHVAAFDTAFHATLSEEQFLYPVPRRWHREYGVRRFGFHGLSVEWSTHRAAELLARPADQLALVVAHLGSGCSVTAVLNGRSVATSMGLTPMEGLMMGTRSGSIDPGILLYMLRTRRTGWRELEEALDHKSGLVGVFGRAGGMRELEKAAGEGNKRAQLAIDMFVSRAAAGIAAAATALPRLDGLVVTGGIGEHSASVRSAIVRRLAPLGLGAVAATDIRNDAVISRAGSAVALLRVEAREDAVIARQTAELV
ncbi:MAG TPA: acetate/propionate family kinase [Candidatus Dormibacteraeota bacterium]|nr:acetate/propionate family kinase [Candidatus Dormibacteraeota bacterium]